MNYSIEVVTPPDKEPVEMSDVRRHIKASSQDDNATLTLIMATAREYIEQESGLRFLTTELKMYLDNWGVIEDSWWDGAKEGAISDCVSKYIELPYGPLQSITHIKTYNDIDVATTWASTEYDVDLRKQDLGRIRPKAGRTWPVPTRTMNGIEIQFKVGYGDEPKMVPNLPKLAIMMQCAHLYQNRGDLITGTIISEAPRGVTDLINKFKIKRLGLL